MLKDLRTVLFSTVYVVGSLCAAAFFFFIWSNSSLNASRVLASKTRSDANAVISDIFNLLSGEASIKYMNLSNCVCFAVLIMLVVLLSYLEDVMLTVKDSLVEKAKLLPYELVQHYNKSYDNAFVYSGVAHTLKQVSKPENVK